MTDGRQLPGVTWDGKRLWFEWSATPSQLLEYAYWLAAIALATVQAWPARQQPSTVDIVSYLDIGDAYLHGRWSEAINGYWNPLYSWILGLVNLIVRPS